MAKCSRRRFNREKICAGDLRHTCSIQERSLAGSIPSQLTPVEQFVDVISSARCAIQTIESTRRRFNGINIEKNATHLFIFRYSPSLLPIEPANHMILFRGNRYRILHITNNDEDNQYLTFQCADRGDVGRDASQA